MTYFYRHVYILISSAVDKGVFWFLIMKWYGGDGRSVCVCVREPSCYIIHTCVSSHYFLHVTTSCSFLNWMHFLVFLGGGKGTPCSNTPAASSPPPSLSDELPSASLPHSTPSLQLKVTGSAFQDLSCTNFNSCPISAINLRLNDNLVLWNDLILKCFTEMNE